MKRKKYLHYFLFSVLELAACLFLYRIGNTAGWKTGNMYKENES